MVLEMEFTHEVVTRLLEAVDGDPRLVRIDLEWDGFRMQIRRDGTDSSGSDPASAQLRRRAAPKPGF